MIHKFLSAKHWQLFIFMFAIPFVVQMVFMMMMMSNMMANIENPNSNPADFLQMFQSFSTVLPIIMILNIAIYFGWFWSIGVGLQKYIPADVKLKVNRFKVFLLFPLVYITLLAIVMGMLFSGISTNPESLPTFIGPSILLIIPLHLFSMFCMFYNLYFVSKTLKTVELQREATIGDCLKEVILFWFYPIGVWIIQPQLNKIISEENRAEASFLNE